MESHTFHLAPQSKDSEETKAEVNEATPKVKKRAKRTKRTTRTVKRKNAKTPEIPAHPVEAPAVTLPAPVGGGLGLPPPPPGNASDVDMATGGGRPQSPVSTPAILTALAGSKRRRDKEDKDPMGDDENLSGPFSELSLEKSPGKKAKHAPHLLSSSPHTLLSDSSADASLIEAIKQGVSPLEPNYNLKIFEKLLDLFKNKLMADLPLDHAVQKLHTIKILQRSLGSAAVDKDYKSPYIEFVIPKVDEGYEILNRVVVALNKAKIYHGIKMKNDESKNEMMELRIREVEVNQFVTAHNGSVDSLIKEFRKNVNEPLPENMTTTKFAAFVNGGQSSQFSTLMPFGGGDFHCHLSPSCPIF